MSILNQSLLLGADAGAAGYQISRSLRFNSSDSAFCSRVFSSAGNRKTWTWAGWVKRGKLGSTNYHLFSAKDGSNDLRLYFFNNDTIEFTTWNGSSAAGGLRKTTQVFRDPSAWYHIVLAYDTTQATAADRIKLYVNGSQVTAFSSTSDPSQNLDWIVNNTIAHQIGAYNTTEFHDGLLADVFFIDGQALTPSSFTEVSATTGQLIPKAYTGSFGTNGFWLKFSDNSAATATTLGKDYSGNNNNWSPSNLSVTAGTGNDSLVDTPTSYGTDTGAGGEVRGNYATFNVLTGSAVSSNFTITNGNLDASGSNANQNPLPSTIFTSTGKWYYEFVRTSGSAARFGVINQAGVNEGLGNGSNGWAWLDDGRLYYQSSVTSYGTAISTGDVVMIALDLDAGKVWYGRNGTWFGSGSPSTGANPSQTFTANQSMSPAVATGSPCAFTANFGQRPFAYTAPSGFKALCDTNLPAPVVAKPNTVFDAVPYTGSSGSQNITTNFSPDLVWVKTRNSTTEHELYDTVRGAGVRLSSNVTLAENNLGANGLTSFNSNGFTVPSTANYGINGSGYTYAAWAWDAGSSTVTNTQGSITSQVRANPSAGFSIVTYTGAGSTSSTIGHGLGVAPSFIITKARTTAAQVNSWRCYHRSLGSTQYIELSSTTAANTFTDWANTSPTSTLFYVGGTNTTFPANESGINYVAYCFAPVAGYSSAFSYSGNGSASDGPYIHLGFKARFLILKRTDASGDDWLMVDTARNPYNLSRTYLYANLSSAEMAYNLFDITANGIKLRDNYQAWNASGATYVGFAWAESPFQYARAR